jgi:hypothetical protein
MHASDLPPLWRIDFVRRNRLAAVHARHEPMAFVISAPGTSRVLVATFVTLGLACGFG